MQLVSSLLYLCAISVIVVKDRHIMFFSVLVDNWWTLSQYLALTIVVSRVVEGRSCKKHRWLPSSYLAVIIIMVVYVRMQGQSLSFTYQRVHEAGSSFINCIIYNINVGLTVVYSLSRLEVDHMRNTVIKSVLHILVVPVQMRNVGVGCIFQCWTENDCGRPYVKHKYWPPFASQYKQYNSSLRNTSISSKVL